MFLLRLLRINEEGKPNYHGAVDEAQSTQLTFALRPDQQRQRRLQLSRIDKRTHQDSIFNEFSIIWIVITVST